MRRYSLTATFPESVHNLAKSIEYEQPIVASCTGCGMWRVLDIVKLAEKVGRDYCLIDRRCRCREVVKEERCNGWVRFHYLRGVYRPLWTYDGLERWIEIDYWERQGGFKLA